MNKIRGGQGACGCSCYYADKGGSSVLDNCAANAESGLRSPNGKIVCESAVFTNK